LFQAGLDCNPKTKQNKTNQKLDRFKLTRITSKKSVRAKIRLNSDDLASAETVTDSANWMLQAHD
jgi:hypothetical protein